MSTVRFYAVVCDHCHYRLDTEADKSGRARFFALLEGWTRARANPARNQMRIDVCPECSDKNNHDATA